MIYIFFHTYKAFIQYLKIPQTLYRNSYPSNNVVNNVMESNNRSDIINSFRFTINHRLLHPKISTSRFSRVILQQRSGRSIIALTPTIERLHYSFIGVSQCHKFGEKSNVPTVPS